MFRDRFWLSLILTIPVVFWSTDLQEWLGYTAPVFPGSDWIPPVLGTIVFVYGGLVFIRGAQRELADRQPGMMTLISLAIVVAFVTSWAGTLGYFEVEIWWELATLITIMLLGHWLEMRSIAQARGALAALAELLPDTAERVTDGGTETVPLSALAVDDVVLVRPGARVPADGVVVEGDADVDESLLTGESKPVPKEPGAKVIAGSVAAGGSLRVRVAAVGEETTLSGIMRMVEAAQASASRAQALADRAAALLFYVAVVAGTITLGYWWLQGDQEGALIRTATVLVIACPHALGLAIPLVISITTAVSAKAGILVKDRLAIERMRTVDAVLFDKTGTLTKGEHTVAGIAGTEGADSDEVLHLAAAVESDSEHPLARAIVAHHGHEHGEGARASDFRSRTGKGVEATVDGKRYAVGGPALLRELDIEPPSELESDIDTWSGRGATVLYLIALNGEAKVLGAIALEDEVRPEARQAIADLRAQGVRKIAMITGDARAVAEAVAADLGFTEDDEVFAEVLPADKDQAVADLQKRGLRVAMVGDGVNDAPALARADVGIAIGAGTDVAIESAGVVLASSDPRGVGGVRRLSKASYRKMIENLGWAAGYNIVAIPLAAGVLAGIGITLSPAVGAVLMSASTIVVALNAQLLRRVRLTPES
jgi:Cu2+-exporting ATPase